MAREQALNTWGEKAKNNIEKYQTIIIIFQNYSLLENDALFLQNFKLRIRSAIQQPRDWNRIQKFPSPFPHYTQLLVSIVISKYSKVGFENFKSHLICEQRNQIVYVYILSYKQKEFPF